MRVVPSHILDPKSAAEVSVHGYLSQIAFGPRDVALHSLNLGRHEYKRWGEADFVIISRLGVLLLEVKGGRVSCRNGVWEFRNRHGDLTRKQESPAAQASSAFFSLLKNYLEPRFRRELQGIPMGFGVVFTDVPRLVGSQQSPLPEQPDEITAYQGDCAGHNTFKAYLARTFEHWRSKIKGNTRELSSEKISEILGYLRPNFERVPRLNTSVSEFTDELCVLTEEQYARFDQIQENDRILIKGGAGTGKTFLAAACARYEAAAGRDALLVTRSPYLAAVLGKAALPQTVTISAFDDLSAKLEAHGPWDVLIIDEGQDLCQIDALDALEKAVKGGLATGRWRWFGDPNRQVTSAHPLEQDALDLLQQCGFRQNLRENIRNAPPIVKAIQDYVGADLGIPKPRGIGSEVHFHRVQTEDQIIPAVERVLAGWVGAQECKRSDIVVLLPTRDALSAVAAELTKGGVRAEALTTHALAGPTRDAVLVASVDDFKGLERPLVCIAGLGGDTDAELEGLAYRGFSRANHTLAVVCTDKDADRLVERRLNLRGGGSAGA